MRLLNLQRGFVKLQHTLKLTITPYIKKKYIREKQVCDPRNTKDKYAEIVNNAIDIGSLNLISYNSDAGTIQENLIM